MGLLSNILKERRILTNVRLTDTQKEVLVRIHSAPNESIAADEALRGGKSHVEATHILQRLGFIDFDLEERTASITETGEQVMKDVYLLDEMGELTQDAQKYTGGAPQPASNAPGEMENDIKALGLESFSLMRDIKKTVLEEGR